MKCDMPIHGKPVAYCEEHALFVGPYHFGCVDVQRPWVRMPKVDGDICGWEYWDVCVLDRGSMLGRWRRKCYQAAVLSVCGKLVRVALRRRLLGRVRTMSGLVRAATCVR